MYKLYIILLVYFFVNSFTLHAQINGYARVTNIEGNTLAVGTVDESHGTFTPGSYIIVMQMQDNAAFPTSNDASFGTPSDIGQAGKYEIAQIASIKRSANKNILKDVVLSQPLHYTYPIYGNTSVQIITYPTLGNPHYTTTTDLAPLAWNGEIGGVLAFKVDGNLYLNHSITTDGKGFGGGSVSKNNAGDCSSSPYRTNNSIYGFKGKTIYGSTNGTYQHARGRIVGGGGGGNTHNAGGGGGSNFSAGGMGGPGFNQGTNCSTTNMAGGLGGASLEPFINQYTLFMGSGGGGGQQNNSASSTGASGGGLIMIKANAVIVAAGRNVRISSNGATALNTGEQGDGAGGGGAGGSILMQVNDYVVDPASTLSLQASGGNGGNVNHASDHGGGGGGGMGVIYTTLLKPNSSNISFSTNAGAAGCNNNSYLRGSCNSLASNGDGSTLNDQRGVIVYSEETTLPVNLKYFVAFPKNQHAILEWETTIEQNNDFFTIYRSKDGIEWFSIAYVKGAGHSNTALKYSFNDYEALPGQNFYRLKQTDFDGKYSYLNIASVKIRTASSRMLITPYPNPSRGEFYLKLSETASDDFKAELYTTTGQQVKTEIEKVDEGLYKVVVSNKLPGMYYLRAINKGVPFTEKISVY
jgi:hypothetical protein